MELEENDAEREGEPADAPDVEGRQEMLDERRTDNPEGNA